MPTIFSGRAIALEGRGEDATEEPRKAGRFSGLVRIRYFSANTRWCGTREPFGRIGGWDLDSGIVRAN